MTTPFGLTPIDFRYFATPTFLDRSTFGIALVPAPAEVIKIVPATITPTKPSSLFGCTSSPSPRAAGGAPLADRPTVSHLRQKSRGERRLRPLPPGRLGGPLLEAVGREL